MGFVAACALAGRIRFAAAKVVAFLFADTFTSALEFKRASGAPAPNKAKQENAKYKIRCQGCRSMSTKFTIAKGTRQKPDDCFVAVVARGRGADSI